MTTKIKTDQILGPHIILDGSGIGRSGLGVTLRLRPYYSGHSRVVLTVIDGRQSMQVEVDAADLIEAVSKLVPAAVSATK